jgi:hypothetical protein
MKKIRTQEPQHEVAIDALMPQVEAAFTGASFWGPFVERAHAAGITRLSDWLNSTGRIVEDQFRRRGLRSTRPADMPLSTSPMDAFIHPGRDSIRPRPYGLKNRERTNRMPMQLHANRQDNKRTYTKHIREWLESARAAQRRPLRHRRCRRRRVAALTRLPTARAVGDLAPARREIARQRISESNLTVRTLSEMREGPTLASFGGLYTGRRDPTATRRHRRGCVLAGVRTCYSTSPLMPTGDRR